MNARTHRTLFLLGVIVWAAFWVMGLPSYYQQYSTAFMVWFDALLLLALAVVFTRSLKRVPATRRRAHSFWMAFYFTVPLAIYDWLYCGVFLNHGLVFVFRYWYVSVYYVIPWFLLPACAAWLNRTHQVTPAERDPATQPQDQ